MYARYQSIASWTKNCLPKHISIPFLIGDQKKKSDYYVINDRLTDFNFRFLQKAHPYSESKLLSGAPKVLLNPARIILFEEWKEKISLGN